MHAIGGRSLDGNAVNAHRVTGSAGEHSDQLKVLQIRESVTAQFSKSKTSAHSTPLYCLLSLSRNINACGGVLPKDDAVAKTNSQVSGRVIPVEVERDPLQRRRRAICRAKSSTQEKHGPEIQGSF